jgi:hypothetical protein
MNMPCLVLRLLAAASMAAAWSAHADALHGGQRLASAMADAALPSNPMPGGGTLLRDSYAADPSRLTGGRAGRQLALLRDGIGRARTMPHVSLGSSAAFR